MYETEDYVYDSDELIEENGIEEKNEFDNSYFDEEFGVEDEDYSWLYYELIKPKLDLRLLYIKPTKYVFEIVEEEEEEEKIEQKIIEQPSRKEIIEKHLQSVNKKYEKSDNRHHVMKPNSIKNKEKKEKKVDLTLSDYQKRVQQLDELLKEKEKERKVKEQRMKELEKRFNDYYNIRGGTFEQTPHEEFYCIRDYIKNYLEIDILEIVKETTSLKQKIIEMELNN